MKSLKAMIAAMFASAAAANPDLNYRHHKEAYPDLGLPRPQDVQDRLIAKAQAKRERKAGRYYTKVLEGKFDKNGNPRTILQQSY